MNIPGGTIIHDDRLVAIWQSPDGQRYAQEKRVSSACRLTETERKEYVFLQGDPVKMTKFLKDSRNLSLADAWQLLKDARGEVIRRRPAQRATELEPLP